MFVHIPGGLEVTYGDEKTQYLIEKKIGIQIIYLFTSGPLLFAVVANKFAIIPENYVLLVGGITYLITDRLLPFIKLQIKFLFVPLWVWGVFFLATGIFVLISG